MTHKHSKIINTVFHDLNTVEKNVDHFLHECFDRLKLSQQNPIEKNQPITILKLTNQQYDTHNFAKTANICPRARIY